MCVCVWCCLFVNFSFVDTIECMHTVGIQSVVMCTVGIQSVVMCTVGIQSVVMHKVKSFYLYMC